MKRSATKRLSTRRPDTAGFIALQPLPALVAGITILLVPRVLTYVVAGWLILFGPMGLLPHLVA
jgi:hypothetical protein